MYFGRESVFFLLALASCLGGQGMLGKRHRDQRRRPSPSVIQAGREAFANASRSHSSIFSTVYDHPKPEDVQVGCKELRSKRYISDGFCTSNKPITELVCTGHCLPIRNLPWYAEFIKVWARTKVLEWRCVNDVVRRKRIRLLCENGEMRSYRIKVVKSCKCKKYNRRQNQSQLMRLKKERRRGLARHSKSRGNDSA